MSKKSLGDLARLQGKRVLVRVDFNVPLNAAGNITNDRRIKAALPTITTLLEKGAAVILMSHLGRPKGDPKNDAVFRMDRVGERLGQLLAKPVAKVDEVVGPKVQEVAKNLKAGGVLILENLRFHPGEQAGDSAFAQQLASLADIYVNDAFGTCHRTDASMVAVPKAMSGRPRVVGLLVAKELEILDQLLSTPARPALAILGGAKVSDKIGFIKSLLERVDKTLVGGAMTYTLMKAQGRAIGSSKAEAGQALEVAHKLLQLAGGEVAFLPGPLAAVKPALYWAGAVVQGSTGKIVLPLDHLVVDKLDAPQTARVVEGDIPDGALGVDIGPKTIALYCQEIAKAATVVWNGPVGKFEDEPYSKGTRAIAQALAASNAVTIVGGGETAEAVEEFGLDSKMTHVSTGGGAFLEYVEGTAFAALAQIEDA